MCTILRLTYTQVDNNASTQVCTRVMVLWSIGEAARAGMPFWRVVAENKA